MLTALRNGFRIIDEEKIDHWLEVIKSGKSTKEMPFSIRIYNIQLIVPELKRYCLEQYKKHNNILISNFYYTPNSENQCMTYHSDICDIVAMQIEGMKTWHFPLDENTHDYLYDYSKTSVKSTAIRRKLFKNEPFETEKINLEKGHWINVRGGLLHHAENQMDSPSGHITFEKDIFTNKDIFNCLGVGIYGSNYFVENYYQRVDLEFTYELYLEKLKDENYMKEIHRVLNSLKLSKLKYGKIY